MGKVRAGFKQGLGGVFFSLHMMFMAMRTLRVLYTLLRMICGGCLGRGGGAGEKVVARFTWCADLGKPIWMLQVAVWVARVALEEDSIMIGVVVLAVDRVASVPVEVFHK